MSLYNFVSRKMFGIPRVDSFDRYLFIGPHPDDIELGCGAVAASLADSGKTMTFLVCTDGRYGTGNRQDLTEEQMVQLRRKESLSAAACLGVSDVRFLDFFDGHGYKDSDMEKAVAKIIGEVNPQVVFVPDPDTESEFHQDHVAIGRMTGYIVNFAVNAPIMKSYGAGSADVRELALYFTDRPNFTLHAGKYFKIKIEALLEHSSQFPAGAENTNRMIKYLKLRRLLGKEEEFRVLDRFHMHCHPNSR